jgi:hypothetical protein
MMRRFLLASALSLALLFGVCPTGDNFFATVAAQKTVHVKGYTKKDGTHVAAHDRKAPKKKGDTATRPAATTPSPTSASTQPRDEKGRFVRSETVRRNFMVLTGYPSGRSGYIVDHIIPLACGGPDSVVNMQWQTVAEAQAKDAWERRGCR